MRKSTVVIHEMMYIFIFSHVFDLLLIPHKIDVNLRFKFENVLFPRTSVGNSSAKAAKRKKAGERARRPRLGWPAERDGLSTKHSYKTKNY